MNLFDINILLSQWFDCFTSNAPWEAPPPGTENFEPVGHDYQSFAYLLKFYLTSTRLIWGKMTTSHQHGDHNQNIGGCPATTMILWVLALADKLASFSM